MPRDWLIAIRNSKGVMQKDVAELVGISQPSYCTIEHGKTRPSVETAKKIAAVLGFDWTRFYEAEGGEGDGNGA